MSRDEVVSAVGTEVWMTLPPGWVAWASLNECSLCDHVWQKGWQRPGVPMWWCVKCWEERQ